MWFTTKGRYAKPRLLELEDRSLPAVDFNAVANQLATSLTQLDSALGAIDTASNRLPVVNRPLTQIPEARDAVKFFKQKLTSAVSGPKADAAALQTAIWQALGDPAQTGNPVSLNILADRNNNGMSDSGDVAVPDFTADKLTVQLDLHKNFTAGQSFDFGLGLDGIPFQADAAGNVVVGVDFIYHDLTFGWDNNVPFFKADAANEMQIALSASLSDLDLTGTIGFLHFSATDATPQVPDLTVTFIMDVARAGNGTVVLQSPHIDGSAEVALKLAVEFAQNFPSISTDFHLHWDFVNTDPKAAPANFGNPPTIELKNVSVGLGNVLSQMVKPIIDVIQPATKPLQPVIDVLNEPLPVLSDLYHLITDPDQDLSTIDLLKLADQYGLIPQGYSELVNLAIVLADLTSLINQVQGDADNLVINFHDFDLATIANGKDLRLLNPLAGDATELNVASLQPDFTNLASSFDFQEVKNLIDGSPIPDGLKTKLKGKLDDLRMTAANGVHYSFPLLDHPLLGVVGLLIGNDADLFTFDATAFAQYQKSPAVSLPLPLGIDAELSVAAKLDTHFAAGYDTRGLREFLADPSNPERLLDGFYVSADTRFKFDGAVTASAGINSGFFSATVDGSLAAGLHVVMDLSKNTDGDNKVHIKSELGPCLFNTDGALSLGLSATVKIGVEILGEFVGVSKSIDFIDDTLFSFSTGCADNPFDKPKPIRLAGPAGVLDPHVVDVFEVTDPNGVLTLNMGAFAGNRQMDDNQDTDEVFVVSHVDPDPAVDPSPLPAGEIVTVSAFGFSERYYGVKKIVAFAGAGSDTVIIQEGVLSDAELHGEDGDDTLKYLGSGNGTVSGGAGYDHLMAGPGITNLYGDDNDDHLTGGDGQNHLEGGNGDDVLTGGSGPNVMYGGDGKDVLHAGPLDDFLDGGIDDDLLVAGPGDATMNGNRGNDQFTWEFGDGSPNIDGGGGLDALGMTGSDATDSFVLRPINNARLQVEVSDDLKKLLATVRSASVELVDVEGLGGADDVVVKALIGTAVEVVSVDTNDKLTPDGAKDTIVVNATAQTESLTVETVDAVLKLPPPHGQGEHGGIMKVSGLPRVAIQLQPSYVVYAMNYADDLTLNAFPGDDAINIKSITGPTTIRGNMANGPALGSDNDVITVVAQKPTVGAVPGDYLDLLTINGDRGMNTLIVDETQSAIADQIKFTSTQITGKLLPGVMYMASGGAWKPGIFLKTGPFADIVNVASTLDGPVTSVATFGGDDIINVSSYAPSKYGNLLCIAGTLSVDTGPGAQNKLNLIDSTATAGNQNVVVTSDKIMGFAGPIDDTIVKFASTFGQLQVLLEGSNTLAEKFLVDSPAAKLVIHGNGGIDQFKVLGTVQSATFDGGLGDDLFTFGFGTQKLDTLLGSAAVLAGPGKDLVLVQDQLAAAGKTYQLGALGLSRTGTGVISFDTSLETLNLGTSNLTNTTQVIGTPTATTVNLNSAGGTDTLIGPNANNIWQILATDAGTLNDRIKFVATEKLLGGVLGDRFIFANGKGLTGNIHGQQGQDILDYGAYTTAVKFNLAANVATNIAGFGGIETLIGGKTLLDVLTGPNQPTDWHIISDDRGLAGPVAFDRVENLVGGTGPDVFNFHEVPGPAPVLAKLTGFLQGQAGIDRLDYTAVSVPVNVDLAAGQATGIGGAVSGIENVTGGQGDDVLLGDALPNVLFGGAGADILLGRGGADELHGDAGRDLLIGGLGADTQFGGADDDLLIAGTTAYDGQPASLQAILAEWNQPAEIYDRRVATLRSGVGPNSSVVLKSATVSDDLAADELWGGLDDDWFWATLPTDTVPDLLQPPERVN